MRVRMCRSPWWGAPGTALHVVSPCLCQEATVGHQSRGPGSFRCQHGGPREGTLAQGAKGAPLYPCPGDVPTTLQQHSGALLELEPPTQEQAAEGSSWHRPVWQCHPVPRGPHVPCAVPRCPRGAVSLSLWWWHAVPTLVARCPNKSVTLSPYAVRQGRRVKESGTEMALGSKPG